MPDITLLTAVGRLWQLRLTRLRPDLTPYGSPDRSLERAVVEDEQGRLFLLERLAPQDAAHKMRVAATLAALQEAGLHAAHAYLADSAGRHVLPMAGSYWQLSPFLQGDPLPRPDWAYQGWRGRLLAGFLAALRGAAAQAALPPVPFFAVRPFVAELVARLERDRPELARAVSPVAQQLLGEWLPSEETLAAGFCHGDPHPLNVTWHRRTIRAVIDWEFCGPKPAAYDAALIIGCAGSEDPEALTGPLVAELLTGLRAASHPAGQEPALWALVLAIRFAWLSDWLRRADEEMVALEVDYIQLLTAERDKLRAAWAR